MLKFIKSYIIIIFLIVITLLSACSSNNDTIQSSSNLEKKINETTETYYTGDLIVKGKKGVNNRYHFYVGGIITNGNSVELIINKQINPEFNNSTSSSYHYIIENGKQIKLPGENLILEIITYDLKKDLIKFKKIDK